MHHSRRSLIAALIAVGAALAVLGGLPAPRASAAAFTVTKTADTNDGTCDSDCSLREAVIAANALAGHDNIAIPNGTYTVGSPLSVTDSVSFNGSGMTTTVISASAAVNVIDVANSAVNLILTDLTVTNGTRGVAADAAEIDLLNTAVTSNGGFGIETVSGWVFLTVSVVEGNNGGISTDSGDVAFVSSTISGNEGPGIVTGSGNVSSTNSTVSGNLNAGIQTGSGDVTLNWTTVAFNGAGIVTTDGLITLNGTIVADNQGADCSTQVEDDSFSLDSDGSCGLGGTSVSNGDANLGPLQNNGGTTNTHALLSGSDAIDAGGQNCPEDDQRATVVRYRGVACDIGSFEADGVAAPTATATATPCGEVCPTATATSVALKTHTPTSTATPQNTSTPPAATNTSTPRPAASATPQGGQGGIVRGPDTGSGGQGAGDGGSLWGVIALAVAGSLTMGLGLWRRRA